MRRYTFYLSVALLAFGMGSLVVFSFYWKTIEQPLEISNNLETLESQSVLPTETKIIQDDKITKYFKKTLEEVCAETKCTGDGTLKPIIKKWLKGEKLKNEVTSLWTLKVRQAFTEESALPSLVDLNLDGKKELILQSECAPVGNCQFDLYIKKGKGYSNLLSTSMVQVFEVLKTSTNTFKDLHLRNHNSAFDSDHQILKFNGRKYIQKKCWNESYEKLDKKGNWHHLKKPIITAIKCENDF